MFLVCLHHPVTKVIKDIGRIERRVGVVDDPRKETVSVEWGWLVCDLFVVIHTYIYI